MHPNEILLVEHDGKPTKDFITLQVMVLDLAQASGYTQRQYNDVLYGQVARQRRALGLAK